LKKLLKEKKFLDTSISNRAGAKWACQCGFKTNFAVRITCYRCLAAKPGQVQSGPSQPSQRTAAAEAARASVRMAASLVAPPPVVVVASVEEDLKQARSRFDWAKSYVASAPSDLMAGTFLSDCEATLKKAKQAVEASRSHPQRLTACLSRQANLLKQSEVQKAEQDRLTALLTEASSKLLVTQASLSEVEQELQALQAAATSAPPVQLPATSAVDLSALTLLVQQCFIAAGAQPYLVDAGMLHGMAAGLGISTKVPDAEMAEEDDGHVSARSRSPDPSASLGHQARRSSSGARVSPYPAGASSAESAKAALASAFISPAPAGAMATQVDPPTQVGATPVGTTPSA
jgi:hypothetical protein